MSELGKLMGKGQDFEIGGLSLHFKPLTLDEIHRLGFEEKDSVEVQLQKSKDLIKYYLKKAVPDATEEEISAVSAEHLENLLSAIMKVNNIQDTKGRKIPKRLNGIKEQRKDGSDKRSEA